MSTHSMRFSPIGFFYRGADEEISRSSDKLMVDLIDIRPTDDFGFRGYGVDKFGFPWSRLRKKGIPSGKGTISYLGDVWKPIRVNINKKGYVEASLRRKGKAVSVELHRLVATVFHGERPPGKECSHRNGVKIDNRPANLLWVTHRENMTDRFIHGTILSGDRHPNHIHPERLSHGERHYCAKLTTKKVLEIRYLHTTGEYSQRVLSSMFGVSLGTIQNLLCRRTWKHVK